MLATNALDQKIKIPTNKKYHHSSSLIKKRKNSTYFYNLVFLLQCIEPRQHKLGVCNGGSVRHASFGRYLERGDMCPLLVCSCGAFCGIMGCIAACKLADCMAFARACETWSVLFQHALPGSIAHGVRKRRIIAP